MVETVERLELPTSTYHTLTRIAKSHGTTPSQVIEAWIEQYQSRDTIQGLRQEYQQLIEKDLNHALTREENKRLDVICDALNDWEARYETSAAWQSKAAAIDVQFEQIERLMTALPEKQTRP